MLNDITRNGLVGLWFAAVAAVIASVVAMGVNVGVSTTALLLALCLVPPGIMVALWGGAAPQTVGEILHPPTSGVEGRYGQSARHDRNLQVGGDMTSAGFRP